MASLKMLASSREIQTLDRDYNPNVSIIFHGATDHWDARGYPNSLNKVLPSISGCYRKQASGRKERAKLAHLVQQIQYHVTKEFELKFVLKTIPPYYSNAHF